MTGKKIFNEIAAAILKFGIVVLLSCGLTSCASLQEDIVVKSNEPVEIVPIEIVYEEIDYSELEDAIKNVNSPAHGFIVEAYFIDTDATGEGRYSISEIPNGEPSRSFQAHYSGSDDSMFNYVKPYQFEIYDKQTYKRIDKTKKYKIYIGVYQRYDKWGGHYNNIWHTFIDKIEGLRTMEEVYAFEAQQKAEAEAKKKAEEEAEKEAKAAANEAKFNPNKLDRSQYKKIEAEDFSFDMAAGNLPAGSKVAFKAMFLIKPTGTKYMFKDINMGITLSSNHNFVRDIPQIYFGSIVAFGDIIPQLSVTVYVTVKKPGQYGECSVDIIDLNPLF